MVEDIFDPQGQFSCLLRMNRSISITGALEHSELYWKIHQDLDDCKIQKCSSFGSDCDEVIGIESAMG
jgi:hypothetical protein